MADTVKTRIPARMDRLPWSGWHWLVVLGLGTVWILDGLEVTIVGAIASRLSEKDALGISEYQVAVGGTFYIAGAAVGALVFGYLTDRLGRKKLFLVSLGLYLVATVLTGLTWSAASFWAFRFLTGLGIGGEYAAINSAIDELIPARARGWVDLAINGSYWLGAAFGAALSGLLLDEALFGADVGWRLAFFLGAALAVAIMIVRRHVPESPRWMMIHGRNDEAERLVSRSSPTWASAPASRSTTSAPTTRSRSSSAGRPGSSRSPARSSRSTRRARSSASCCWRRRRSSTTP